MKEFYSGHEAEIDLLGVHPELLRMQGRQPEKLGYIGGIEFAKNRQPGDPTNPVTRFGREFRNSLCQALFPKLVPAANKHVRFYTSLYTSLDWYDATDAFVEVDNPRDGKTYLYRMNVTTDPHKTGERVFFIDKKDIPEADESNVMFDYFVSETSRRVKKGIIGNIKKGDVLDVPTERKYGFA